MKESLSERRSFLYTINTLQALHSKIGAIHELFPSCLFNHCVVRWSSALYKVRVLE